MLYRAFHLPIRTEKWTCSTCPAMMTTIDELLKELYNTGSDIANGLEHDGRIGLALQVRLQETLARAEKFMAGSANGNGNKPASKGKASKFATLKSLIELLKPYTVYSRNLEILNTIHIDGNKAWATNLSEVIEVEFSRAWLGPDCSIPMANMKQLESMPLDRIVDNAHTFYTGSFEYKLDKNSDYYKENYSGKGYNIVNDVHEWKTFEGESPSEVAIQEYAESSGLEVTKVEIKRHDILTVNNGNKTLTVKGADPRERPQPGEFKPAWEATITLAQLEAMARVAICASQDFSRPILTSVFTNDNLDIQGNIVEVAYNAEYLQACLTCLDGEQVTIQIGGPSWPARFDSNDGTAVLMPMHISR
jgi:hypothetical protein